MSMQTSIISEINGELKKWLQVQNKFPEKIQIQNKEYTICDRNNKGFVDLKGRIGKKGFVLRVEAEFNKYALKINIPEAYRNRDPITELSLISKLNGNRSFVNIISQDKVHIESLYLFFQNKKCYCFVMEWVEGHTLKNIILHKPETFFPDKVKEYLQQIIDAVLALKNNNLKHDDLHIGNIMICEEGSIKKREYIKIVDAGSLKDIGEKSNYLRKREDFYNFVVAMSAMRDAIFGCRSNYKANERFIKELDKLITKLNDDDELRVLGEHMDSLHGFYDAIYIEIENLPTDNFESTNTTLVSPFDALSVEYFSNDKLILDLFVHYDKFYKHLINGTNPVIMSGPRGCGKSMAFRYVAASTHLSCLNEGGLNDDFKNIPYFGIYISCSKLQPYVSWISEDKYRENTEYYQQSLVTLFSLHLTIELLKVLNKVVIHDESIKYYQTSISKIKQLSERVFTEIKQGLITPTDYSQNLSKISKISSLQNILININGISSNYLLQEKKLPIILGESYLNIIGELTYEALNESRKIVYLLDDYTFTRIPEIVQKSLNRIIWQRNNYQHFNISAEKNSYSSTDYQGTDYINSREYDVVDMANLVLGRGAKHEKESINFVKKMVNNRLKASKWKHNIETLLGNSEYKNHSTLAKKLHHHKGGTLLCYFGIEIIALLWSGDIALILQILSKITEDCNSTTKTIPKEKQHTIIKEISSLHSNYINNYYYLGKEMQKVASAFGAYAHTQLKNDCKMIPRLEFSLNPGEIFLDSLKEESDDAYNIAKELIKKTIFIKLDNGKAKEAFKDETIRWQFKKIYYPSYNMALGKDTYLDIRSIAEFVMFLTDSSEYIKQKIKDKTSNEQLSLEAIK